jgi:N-ethylmaleimide reductase
MTSPLLLRPLNIGAMRLPNRLVMPALTRLRAGSDGVPTDLMRDYYAQRASAGLIVTECTMVSSQARGLSGCPGIYDEAQQRGWSKVAEAVHAAGGRIFCQLWHAGAASHPTLQPDGGAPVAPSEDRPPLDVFTASGTRVPSDPPRALELNEMAGIAEQFATAAARALAADFDGVEIHSANGYLLEQFLRRSTNRRSDEYGGSGPNRGRLVREVIDAVVEVAGAEWTGLRLSPWGELHLPEGDDDMDSYESVVLHASQRGLAYLHLIEPRASGAPVREHETLGDVRAATVFREIFAGPLISAGGWTFETAEQASEAGVADAFAFGRGFLANPDLPERFRRDAPLNPYNRPTFYGGGAAGYVDYPTLDASSLAG